MNNLCFDIGGTYIKYALICDDKIILSGRIKTPLINCSESIPKIIVKKAIELISELPFREVLDGIGISSAGQIDHLKGEVLFATDNLPGYTGTKLKTIMENETKIRCVVENDVNAAAIGEMAFGCARGRERFLLLTIGTGIGGAVVSGGKILRGEGGLAGEVGHMIIELGGRSCTCGGNGCFEQYASASSLLHDYEIYSGKKVNGFEIMELIKTDPTAIEVFDMFIDSLAVGISNLIHILDPGLIVLGGGISRSADQLLSPLKKNLATKVMKSFWSRTNIMVAQHHNNAALLGVNSLLYK